MNAVMLALIAAANTLTWPGAFAVVGCALASAAVAVALVFAIWRL